MIRSSSSRRAEFGRGFELGRALAPLDDLSQTPTLPGGERARLHDFDGVADLRRILLVVGHERRRALDGLTVDVVTDQALDGMLRVELAKEIAWEKEIGGGVEAYPTIADGKLMVATTDASLLALDLKTGDRVWDAPTGLLQRIKARPTVAGPSVYVITLNGVLHQIRLADGKIVDRLDLGAEIAADDRPGVAVLAPPIQAAVTQIGVHRGEVEAAEDDALIAIGCVIRGETYHFELVANESAAGVSRVASNTSSSRARARPRLNARCG